MRVERGQLVELHTLLRGLGIRAVDSVEAYERVELLLALAFTGLTNGARDGIALAQPGTAHLVERDVDVVRAGQVARRADETVVVADVEDAGDGNEYVVLRDRRFGVATKVAIAATSAVTVAVTPAAAAAAAVKVVVVAWALVSVALPLRTVALLTVALLTVALLALAVTTVGTLATVGTVATVWALATVRAALPVANVALLAQRSVSAFGGCLTVA